MIKSSQNAHSYTLTVWFGRLYRPLLAENVYSYLLCRYLSKSCASVHAILFSSSEPRLYYHEQVNIYIRLNVGS